MKNLSVNSKKIISCVEKGIAMILCVTTLGAFASCSSKSSEKENATTSIESQVDKNQNNLKDAEKRSEEIRNAEDHNVKFIETYDVVSETKNFNGENLYIVSLKEKDGTVGLFNYNTLTEEIPCGKYDYISSVEFKYHGKNYRNVSIPDDGGYEFGWLNMETLKEDIPCKKYDYIGVGDFSYKGKNYRDVSVPDDGEYEFGWLNMETFEEDIPCKKYNYISEGNFRYKGNFYRYVRVPDDEEYECGWLNMETFEEDIPCKRYDYIGKEDVKVNGNLYRFVSVPNDIECELGWLNMETFNEDIPCATYTNKEHVIVDGVDYYVFNDKEGKEKVYSFKK